METGQLKTFAQNARRHLLDQISSQLWIVLQEGSLARRENAGAVTRLEERIRRSTQEQVIDEVAYTWFNRFCALRFMDVHGYTRLGTVSGAEGFTQPEILMEAKQGVIDDQWQVDKQRVFGLLDHSLPSADPEGEAYKLLIVGVCNSLHSAMPFLFEKIGDETELLLPANLLHTDSLIRQLVEQVDEALWQEIEIIGWLYQFYISEKKDQVIGKVVKSEDIPAATQLFTPNWIVKYMVQNSLGAQWLATYPNSPLKEQMEYYIEPAEQTDEVNAQLAATTPSQLNPEELTLIDPASGSGHILVEAYELFKAIYLERGYQKRDVPQLILEKNLFGLDIDERAAQLTGFALMMKGRADDRRLFERGVKLNVMALVDSAGFDAEGLAKGVELADYGLKPGDLAELKRLFEHATTFGSLIQVSEGLAEKLPALKQLSEATSSDLFVSEALKRMGPLVQQAESLAAKYDAVVANPPYMGRKSGMNALSKSFVNNDFPDAKIDLFACFIERGYTLAKEAGANAMVTMHGWMFLPSFEKFRERLLQERTIATMAHFGPGGFAHASAMIVQTTAFVLKNLAPNGYKPVFFRLLNGGEQEKKTALLNREERFDSISQDDFVRIPSSPLAYWVSEEMISCFDTEHSISDLAPVKQGLATGNHERFLRHWHEVDSYQIDRSAVELVDTVGYDKTWYPHNKGGAFRKWFGNHHHVINWRNNGEEVKAFVEELNKRKPGGRLKNQDYYFKPSATWTDITAGSISARFTPPGFTFDVSGPSIFDDHQLGLYFYTALLNSRVCGKLIELLNPTLHANPGDVAKIPVCSLRDSEQKRLLALADHCIGLGAHDWNAYERSWDFQSLPLLTASSEPTPTLESSYTAWITQNQATIAEMKRLEEENNLLFIDAYGLADELTPDVPIEQITLTVNPAYRYGGKLTVDEQWTRFRQDTMEELVSYAIGCMMGRYSLDAPGLIYAHSGNEGFDPSQYTTFPADDDNVIPLLDGDWFPDDITERLKEFLKAAFSPEHYEENLTYLEDGLFPGNETARKRKTIRDYFLKDFYGNHIKTYKKRPIYWLFSSPKGTFNALIYLHRYRPDTVSSVLGYLRDFNAKLTAKIDSLQHTADSADASASEKTKALKDIVTLKKQVRELDDYERDTLYPLATERLEIDLDDGVKANYPKFGKALKKITGL
jgi:type II restriction/modification system DNA methylase subunit YeeA